MDVNWLTLGGNEVINTARVQAYAAGVETSDSCGAGVSVGCACPGLAQAIEGADFGGYVDPVVDGAPWLEETAPESAEFLGVFGLEEEGGSVGVVERTPVELAGGGSNIGVERFNHREVTYQVVLVARSEAGLSYGLMWLSSVLRGPAGGQGCWGDQACVFAWCPSGEAEGDRAQRVLYDVGLLEAPTVSNRFRSGGGVFFAEVEFTLVSGNPHLYALPYISLGPGDGEDDVVRVPAGGPIGECDEPLPCRRDAECAPPPLPPRPPQPVDPCWPLSPFRARRTMFTVPPGGVSSWSDTVPVVRVNTRGAPMRRLSVRFYSNPTGQDCGRYTDRCAACGEVNVAFLPESTEMVVDGRIQRARMDCSGGRGLAVSRPTLFGPNGGLFSWPVIECASGLCIEVLWQEQGSDPEAEVSIDMVARMGAA